MIRYIIFFLEGAVVACHSFSGVFCQKFVHLALFSLRFPPIEKDGIKMQHFYNSGYLYELLHDRPLESHRVRRVLTVAEAASVSNTTFSS